VKVDVASHSPQMDPLAAELRAELADLAPAAGSLPIYSTVAGAQLPGADFDAAYWARNLRQPVRFADAVGRLLDDDVSVFVELGPHPVLTQAVQQTAAATERLVAAIPFGRRNESDRLGAYAAVAGLWVTGARPTWSRLMPAARTVPLPLYPWQRETYWVDAAQPARADGAPRARQALNDEQRHWLYVPHWEPSPMEPGAPRRWLLVGAQAAEVGLPATVVPTVADAARWAAALAPGDDETGILFLVDPSEATPAWNAVDALRTLQAAWPAGRPTPRLWWATTGAQRVADETPSPRAAEQGAVWGAARVVATEHPDWWGGLVDLDPSLPLAAQRETLARHLAAKRSEDQVALRGSSRFALRLGRAPSSLGAAPASFQWRADGAYLVTGGFGGIAQRVATEMVRQGARRLVLLGRTALPPRASWGTLPADSPAGQRVAFVRALEHAGASVHVLHADVADETQLRAALDGYHAEGWPPIVGVLHTAGVLDTRLTHDMDAAAFARVLQPKLAGAVALDRLLPELDLFVAFSSMMAFWAPPGEANYSAANAGLDALVQARRARGQHALAIQWGPWTDVGMWQGSTGDRSMQALAREGVRSFSAAEGVAFLAPLLSASEPVVAVVPVDWRAFAAARRGRPSPLFQHLVDAVAPEEQAAASSLPTQLREASPLARRALVDTLVRTTLGAVLRRPAEGIDATRPFGTMGLDSLMALDLRNRLETALERPLPATLAWNYPTVAQLAAHLETLFADAAPEPTPEPEPVAAPAETGFSLDSLFDDLTLLSDEDAARALRGGR
jgi:acyl transferase domain-containing protein